MRIFFTTLWLLIILGGISTIFWHSELKYSLPTPVPPNYQPVKTDEYVELNGKLGSLNRPLFIHFFNPGCPCSRFNIDHFRSLVRKYGNRFDFAIVVMDKGHDHSAVDIQNKFDLSVPVSFDSTIAVTCGVYSTPQAVILDAQHRLYYRGNYNKSRYCSDVNSEYARMAADSFLTHHINPQFGPFAVTAYGCQLPNCTK